MKPGAGLLAVVAALSLAVLVPARGLAQTEEPSPDAGSGEDVTETIDLGEGTTATTKPTPTPAAPPAADTLEVRAWLRSVAEFGPERVGRFDDAPDPFAVPHDRVVLRGQMHLRLRYAKEKRYEVVVSGLSSYGLFEEGAKRSETFIAVNGQRTRTEFETLLREAYVGFSWPTLDLHLGSQRVAWGKGDVFAPNDIINPRDLRDPILGETEVQHVPTFALRLDLEAGAIGLQAVVAPFFRPNRFDLYGSNWAAIQSDAPAPYRGFMALQSGIADVTLDGVLQPVVAQTQGLPSDDFSATSAGLRLRWSKGGYDGNVYFHYGYDSTPRSSVDPRVVEALAGIDFSTASAASLAPILDLIDSGVRLSTTEYVHRLHQGADIETALGERWIVRADAAYDSALVYSRRVDFSSVVAPTIQVVAAAEYQTGEVGRTFLVEAWYQRLAADVPPDGELIGVNQNSASIAALWKWSWFDEQLGVEVRAIVGLSPRSYLLVPRLTTKVGQNTTLALGFLALDGEDNSVQHIFRYNRAGFFVGKYSF